MNSASKVTPREFCGWLAIELRVVSALEAFMRVCRSARPGHAVRKWVQTIHVVESAILIVSCVPEAVTGSSPSQEKEENGERDHDWTVTWRHGQSRVFVVKDPRSYCVVVVSDRV